MPKLELVILSGNYSWYDIEREICRQRNIMLKHLLGYRSARRVPHASEICLVLTESTCPLHHPTSTCHPLARPIIHVDCGRIIPKHPAQNAESSRSRRRGRQWRSSTYAPATGLLVVGTESMPRDS